LLERLSDEKLRDAVVEWLRRAECGAHSARYLPLTTCEAGIYSELPGIARRPSRPEPSGSADTPLRTVLLKM
jgi:hypothetical protein